VPCLPLLVSMIQYRGADSVKTNQQAIDIFYSLAHSFLRLSGGEPDMMKRNADILNE